MAFLLLDALLSGRFRVVQKFVLARLGVEDAHLRCTCCDRSLELEPNGRIGGLGRIGRGESVIRGERLALD